MFSSQAKFFMVQVRFIQKKKKMKKKIKSNKNY